MNIPININADMGEGFGVYDMANDEILMRWVPTVNIACGFHAGDSHVMRKTVQNAVAKGVEIGAHVGLPDILGFGRRRIDVSPEQLGDYVLHQLGALDGFVRKSGGKMLHVKPHGSLFGMCSEEERYADALLEAMVSFDRTLSLILAGNVIGSLASCYGVKVYHEAYCDLEYRPDGTDIIEPRKRAWDPQEVARRAVRLTETGSVTACDGQEIKVRADTICIHGDAPNAADIVTAVVTALHSRGIPIVGLQHLEPKTGT